MLNIHVHKVFTQNARIVEIFIKKWVYVLIEMVCLFFSDRKNTTNAPNWSKVNRNGLHSLEESQDLEDSSNMVQELQLLWYVMYTVRNNELLIVTLTSLQSFGFTLTAWDITEGAFHL